MWHDLSMAVQIPKAVQIRSATTGDLRDVAALWSTSAHRSGLPSGLAEAERLVARDPDALIVADRDGTIVGTLIVGWDGWRCSVYRLAVADSERRSGIGSALFAEAKRRAEALGIARIDGMVDDDNEGGIAFWRSQGFRPDEGDHRWTLGL